VHDKSVEKVTFCDSNKDGVGQSPPLLGEDGGRCAPIPLPTQSIESIEVKKQGIKERFGLRGIVHRRRYLICVGRRFRMPGELRRPVRPL
jgi:hypothetical protein